LADFAGGEELFEFGGDVLLIESVLCSEFDVKGRME